MHFRLKKDLKRTIENIEKKYPSLFQLNIPKIESDYIFTRFELHSFYSKFKALVYMNALDTKQKDFRNHFFFFFKSQTFFNLSVIYS